LNFYQTHRLLLDENAALRSSNYEQQQVYSR
jgi:hypothetical protein